MKFKNQKGQAVLIVLLSLSVVLIVVMFVVSRSITDISLSSKEENSLRAFSAAEAGIERALVIGSGQTGSFDDASFSASVTNFAQGSDSVVYPVSLKSGESAVFWFSRPSETNFTGNLIKLCWGDVGTPANDSKTPTIEFAVYYTTTPGDYRTIRVARALFDGASSSNPCSIGDENFQFQTNVNLSSIGVSGRREYASAKILYNDTIGHKVGIDVSSGSSALPSQGVKIESEGNFGQANRRIEVYQLYAVAPVIFENAIFSSSGITK